MAVYLCNTYARSAAADEYLFVLCRSFTVRLLGHAICRCKSLRIRWRERISCHPTDGAPLMRVADIIGQ